MSDQLLDIDVRLLIVRYGRQRVLQAIARLGDQTLEQLEQQLVVNERRQKERRKRVKPSLLELAASESQRRPEIAEPLRTLAAAFENRTFLPTVRHVQRFLDRANPSQGKVKSRAVAGPAVIRILSRLNREDLLRLIADEQSGSESDYSVLARAIMGTATTLGELYGTKVKPTKD